MGLITQKWLHYGSRISTLHSLMRNPVETNHKETVEVEKKERKLLKLNQIPAVGHGSASVFRSEHDVIKCAVELAESSPARTSRLQYLI